MCIKKRLIKITIKKNSNSNFYFVRSKTPLKTITQNHNNQNFYYKNNFYIEIPQEKVIKPHKNNSFISGNIDREKQNLYNYKFQYGEGAMEEHNSNLFWNEHNTPCKIFNYEYRGNASISVNEFSTQKELEIIVNYLKV